MLFKVTHLIHKDQLLNVGKKSDRFRGKDNSKCSVLFDILHSNDRYEGPPTPCPAKVEYATPVFAKNYQGSWRYVVQIPYEGYFTQTVEVTRCLQVSTIFKKKIFVLYMQFLYLSGTLSLFGRWMFIITSLGKYVSSGNILSELR